MPASALVLAACGTPVSAPSHETVPPAPATAAPETSAPLSSTSPPTSAAGTEPQGAAAWLTYHHDAQRSGSSPVALVPRTLHRLWRTVLDGQVYAEPLVDGPQVIVATENDTVYSLNAASGRVQWSTHVGTPVPAAALPCGDISPSGITGTPVIDPASRVVWVVAAVAPGVHQLVGLGLADGRIVARRSISLPGVDPSAEQQRGALALVDGRVYVPFGGLYGDCSDYRGFVVGFPADGVGTPVMFAVPASRGAGVWAPAGPVADPAGDLFIATGNSAATGRADLGDSVLRLSGSLRLEDSFTPSDWRRLDQGDLDLGSTSPALVGGSRILQVGKSGTGYLLARDRLGGTGGQLAAAPVCPEGAFGGTAVDSARSLVVVSCRSHLAAMVVGPRNAVTVAWTGGPQQPGPPVISGGVVWDVSRSGRLVGLDEATGRSLTSLAVGAGATSFPSLAIADGRLFAQGERAVVAFASS